MVGLFGSLNLGQRSLQTQQQGVEIAGHNLANVNQPGYSRQRLVVQPSSPVSSSIGPQGVGVDGVAIEQVRNALLDGQIQGDASARNSLETRQQALQNAQSILGQPIDTSASGAQSANSLSGAAGTTSMATMLTDFFNGFSAMATQPVSLEARQNVLTQAQNLARRLNQMDQNLSGLQSSLVDTARSDAKTANRLLDEVAKLNQQIQRMENSTGGTANDLRDMRQQKLEELAKYADFETAEGSEGLRITLGGTTLVSGMHVEDHLSAKLVNGSLEIHTATADAKLSLGGGSLQGAVESRDTMVSGLRKRLDDLASALTAQVNAVHATGYNLNGVTGASFFTGDSASTIAVNNNLVNNPSLIQASGDPLARSNNKVALALAHLQEATPVALGQQTFNDHWIQTVAGLGETAASVNTQLVDQKTVGDMLKRQRDSVSGVSMDEEMTSMVKFQKAFQASARLINTIDEMLDTVLNLKR